MYIRFILNSRCLTWQLELRSLLMQLLFDTCKYAKYCSTVINITYVMIDVVLITLIVIMFAECADPLNYQLLGRDVCSRTRYFFRYSFMS